MQYHVYYLIHLHKSVYDCSTYTVMYNGYHNNSSINLQPTILVPTNEEGLL
jgi:hypothetical protein